MILERFSKRILCALLLCFVALVGAVGAYAYLMYSQSGTSEEADFTFTWGPDTQKIVNGTFRLEISFERKGEEKLTVIIKANDDDYSEDDGVGLVFDTNQNGYLDKEDEAYALFADNMTITGGYLSEKGAFYIPSSIPELGPHRVTFDPKTGYTFIVKFPWVDQYGREWNPARALKTGEYPYTARNKLYVDFVDGDAYHAVDVQFCFYIFEEAE